MLKRFCWRMCRQEAQLQSLQCIRFIQEFLVGMGAMVRGTLKEKLQCEWVFSFRADCRVWM
jgi:hypothetical protein